MRRKEREMIVSAREKMSSALVQKEQKVEVGGRMILESRGNHNVIKVERMASTCRLQVPRSHRITTVYIF